MNYVKQYVDILEGEFSHRCAVNSSYSLRAFARDLDISASQLSNIFRGKKGLSPEAADKIVGRMNWTEGEKTFFCHLVTANHGRSRVKKDMARKSVEDYLDQREGRHEIDETTFEIISSWHHFAIIELMKLEDFESCPAWISKKLGISRLEVRNGLKRLEKVGIIKTTNDGLSLVKRKTVTSDGIPSKALRDHHSQIIAKALQAVSEQSVDERTLSSLTVAISDEIVPELQEKISRFRKEINLFISGHKKNKKPNQVYCVSNQLFRLTKRI